MDHNASMACRLSCTWRNNWIPCSIRTLNKRQRKSSSNRWHNQSKGYSSKCRYWLLLLLLWWFLSSHRIWNTPPLPKWTMFIQNELYILVEWASHSAIRYVLISKVPHHRRFIIHGPIGVLNPKISNHLFFQEKYPPLVFKVKWQEAIYKVVQCYKQCCETVPNDHSQAL